MFNIKVYLHYHAKGQETGTDSFKFGELLSSKEIENNFGTVTECLDFKDAKKNEFKFDENGNRVTLVFYPIIDEEGNHVTCLNNEEYKNHRAK